MLGSGEVLGLKCRVCNSQAVVIKTFENIENEYPLCASCGFEKMFEFGITSVKKLEMGGVKN
jgi:transcription elongation factor Elf1